MKVLSKRWLLASVTVAIAAALAAIGGQALAGSKGSAEVGPGTRAVHRTAAAGPLDRESAIQVDLSNGNRAAAAVPRQARTARRSWFVLLDASDQGIAHDLGVELRAQARQHRDRRPGGGADGDARLADAGPEQVRAGGSSTSRARRTSARPGSRQPGRTASRWRTSSRVRSRNPGYSPFIRIAGSPTRSTARRSSPPATAPSTGRTTRTPVTACSASTSPGPSAPGQFAESWVDLLFVKGFDAGQPIVYISTDARPAADLGARALDLRARARTRPPTTAGMTSSALPASGCSASSTARPAPTTGVAGVRAPGQGRPRLRGRQRRQHRADRRSATTAATCSTCSATSRP